MINKEFPLYENFSIIIEKNENNKDFFIKDNIFNTKRLLISLTEDLRWDATTSLLANEFWTLVKTYPSKFKNNIFKPMDEIHEITLDKKINCFKRKFKVKLNRATNKLKNG